MLDSQTLFGLLMQFPCLDSNVDKFRYEAGRGDSPPPPIDDAGKAASSSNHLWASCVLSKSRSMSGLGLRHALVSCTLVILVVGGCCLACLEMLTLMPLTDAVA